MLSQFGRWVQIAEEYLNLKTKDYSGKPEALKFLDAVIEKNKVESFSKGYLLAAVTSWASTMAHRDEDSISEKEAIAKMK